jgi:hypothetical protein
MTPFIIVCAVFVAIWFLGVVLSRHIQGLLLLLTGSQRIATAGYDLVVLPGVVLHELSHAAIALLLGIRVLSINLFQFRGRNDPRQGEVVVAKADPFRMSIVGAAPLFFGVATLLLLVRWLDPPTVGLNLAAIGQLRALLSHWSTAIGLYLLFAVANTMFPSAADRKAWWTVGIVFFGIAVVLLLLGVQPQLPPRWVTIMAAQADLLTSTLLPVIVLDIVCLVVVLMLELLVGRLRGQRVMYHKLR